MEIKADHCNIAFEATAQIEEYVAEVSEAIPEGLLVAEVGGIYALIALELLASASEILDIPEDHVTKVFSGVMQRHWKKNSPTPVMYPDNDN